VRVGDLVRGRIERRETSDFLEKSKGKETFGTLADLLRSKE
jgi:hypothetical protein